ncbi:MAG: SHOCT domain-containing protein [Candidatus Eremiobacteraeota bacterium]|nr:SHOCT domain-containing protein [Candidatus Eremiobacteraeota bacterium]
MPLSQWLWAIGSWAVIIGLIAWAYIHFSRKAAAARARIARLEQAGVKAPGLVLAVKDTGMSINDNPNIRITFRVTPENGQQFDTTTELIVSRLDVPREGEEYWVVYDPQDTTNFGFGDRISAPASTAAAADDPVARLERAAQLRDRGVISEAEFETLKQKVLGS